MVYNGFMGDKNFNHNNAGKYKLPIHAFLNSKPELRFVTHILIYNSPGFLFEL